MPLLGVPAPASAGRLQDMAAGREAKKKGGEAKKTGGKKAAVAPAPAEPEPAGPRDLDEAIAELRKTEPARVNVPAPSKPAAAQQTQDFPLKRQLSNPKAGFITRVEKPNNRPSRDGALTEAGRQVQKRDGDKPRKSGELLGFIRRVKK